MTKIPKATEIAGHLCRVNDALDYCAKSREILEQHLQHVQELIEKNERMAKTLETEKQELLAHQHRG